MKKLELIEKIKKLVMDLAKEYDSNLKLDVNVNPQENSVKVNITEYNL